MDIRFYRNYFTNHCGEAFGEVCLPCSDLQYDIPGVRIDGFHDPVEDPRILEKVLAQTLPQRLGLDDQYGLVVRGRPSEFSQPVVHVFHNLRRVFFQRFYDYVQDTFLPEAVSRVVHGVGNTI